MGKASRERRRRAEKARGQRPPGAAFVPPDTGPTGLRSQAEPTAEELVAAAIWDAVRALDRDDEAAVSAAVTTLGLLSERLAPFPEHREQVKRSMANLLLHMVGVAWQFGWQPADVVRLAARRPGQVHSALLGRAIAVELDRYATTTIDPCWLAQLNELGIELGPGGGDGRWLAEDPTGRLPWPVALRTGIEVLHLLGRLPQLEPITALPGTASTPTHMPEGPAPDERMLSRVRALLAKAESTPYPAEAETFTAGAQAMMARHSIDTALLASTSADHNAPTAVRIGIDNPYEAPKASLLDVVAKANRCRAIWNRGLGFCTVVGFKTDLCAVETVFTSLLVQATKAMSVAGSRTDSIGRSRTRSFRQSFLLAYAQRIGERLEETTQEQTREATQEPGGSRLLPVLAARQQEVDEAVDRLFSALIHRATRWGRDAEGWRSGRAAADLAVMGPERRLPA
jgi:hypothetical protein